MAAVYKALSKAGSKKEETASNGVTKENKQRVLILSSRGVTFRYESCKQWQSGRTT
jgi:hypothetical protein